MLAVTLNCLPEKVKLHGSTLSYLIFRYFRTISYLSGTYRVINPFIMKYSTYLSVCFNGPVEEFCLSTY